MQEILYGYSELLIVAGLLVGLLLAVELGFLLGHRRQHRISESVRLQINAVLASTVGLLALLLGFTFSLAIERYEARNQAVVTETNAIGTTYLRTWLLPADMQEPTRDLLRRYVAVLVQEGHIPLADTAARKPLQEQATRISNQIWSQAISAAERDPRLLTSGLFIQTLNEQIDATAARNAELSRHVPEIVIWLIMAASLFATALLGFASGISGERASISAGILAATLIMVFYLIITLDRPRSGPIRTNPQPVHSLMQSMQPEWAPLMRPNPQTASSQRPE
jgi:protein-S-isoprenylcysteine O-methyltransferase Ste14